MCITPVGCQTRLNSMAGVLSQPSLPRMSKKKCYIPGMSKKFHVWNRVNVSLQCSSAVGRRSAKIEKVFPNWFFVHSLQVKS